MTEQKKKLRIPKNRRKPIDPFWDGPAGEGPEGGITQSILGGYFICPERFRVKYILGLNPLPKFNHYIEYGNIWHELEECYSRDRIINTDIVEQYREKLHAEYPLNRAEVNQWCDVALLQFPLYVDYWKEQPEEMARKNLFAEVAFRVSYKLPSGRRVYLRGKWDAVDLLDKEVWLQENKTKSVVDRMGLEQQLQYDLQVLFYLTALRHATAPGSQVDAEITNLLMPKRGKTPIPVRGVRYNVVRRPLSGGKGSIKRKKARPPTKTNPKGTPQEKLADFYERLKEVMQENIDTFFNRWNVGFESHEFEQFERTTLNPILENLLDDYEWWTTALAGKVDPFDYKLREQKFPHHAARHYRLPYGVGLSLFDGGNTDLDNYLATGSIVGLRRPRTLFPELQ